MRIEELDMTLRTWTASGKMLGHVRAPDGRTVTIGVIRGTGDEPRWFQVTIMQGAVSVQGDWHDTLEASYEQTVLEALEGAPRLARTIADITHAVRMRRQAARVAERLAADQAERDAGVTPIADMYPIEEEGFNL